MNFARTPRRGKFATWAAGLGIFFDDYANTLIVGNTMRPITDRLKVSREKLAYIVDSTAAPVAAIVPARSGVEEQSIIDFVAEKTARYKLPRRIVMVPRIPRTAAGKIQVHLVKDLCL